MADDDGAPRGAATVTDTAGVARLEAGHRPRWLWDSAPVIYPDLLRAGVRLQRCVDLGQQERVLLARAGRHGEPASAAAVLARRDGRPPSGSADCSTSPAR